MQSPPKRVRSRRPRAGRSAARARLLGVKAPISRRICPSGLRVRAPALERLVEVRLRDRRPYRRAAVRAVRGAAQRGDCGSGSGSTGEAASSLVGFLDRAQAPAEWLIQHEPRIGSRPPALSRVRGAGGFAPGSSTLRLACAEESVRPSRAARRRDRGRHHGRRGAHSVAPRFGVGGARPDRRDLLARDRDRDHDLRGRLGRDPLLGLALPRPSRRRLATGRRSTATPAWRSSGRRSRPRSSRRSPSSARSCCTTTGRRRRTRSTST